MSLLEAISSGVSVLASKVSGIKDILEDFESALFEPGNSLELFMKIEDKLFKEKKS